MRVDLIGVPLGLGANAAGPERGPQALRAAGLPAALRARAHAVFDRGDLPAPGVASAPAPGPGPRHLGPIVDVASRLVGETAAAVARGAFPLVLGGDHSVALGSIGGAARGRRLGVVWMDAHADFNTTETSPSGNLHGMPLAALAGLGDPRLVGLSGARGRVVDPRRVALLGVRSIDPGERALLAGAGVTVIGAREVERLGIAEATGRALEVASRGADGIYLSFDVDVLDPGCAPGVTTPVPGGLAPDEARLACALIQESGRLIGMDVVELTPSADAAGGTARLVVDLICAAAGGGRPSPASGDGRPW
ncbi:MAG TPA: arginase [Polyangiaceae bacterium]|nr:arginase [Polyangiaceae bacterium]